LSETHLATAADYQCAAGITLADALIELGFIDPLLLQRIDGERDRAAGLPIAMESVDRDLLARLPKILLARSTALPIRCEDRVIIASNAAIEPLVRDDLERLAGRSLEFVRICDEGLRRRLRGLAAALLGPPSVSPIATK